MNLHLIYADYSISGDSKHTLRNLEGSVLEKLSKGWALHGNIITNDYGLAQQIVESEAEDEYQLLYAQTPSEFDRQVYAACKDGWAPYGNAHYWWGWWVQWFCRSLIQEKSAIENHVVEAIPVVASLASDAVKMAHISNLFLANAYQAARS